MPMEERDTPQERTAPAGPVLDAVQARVLGALIEKALTTPEQYPLTLNAAVLACNQKSNREPVMELEPGAVGHALRQLEDLKLVRVVHGARALRYEHVLEQVIAVTPRQRALVCLMLLRGQQTVSELYARSERLADFPSPDDVRDTLERLATRTPPLALRLPRQPGQREERWTHLMCGEPVVIARAADADDGATVSAADAPTLVARIAELEATVAALAERVAALEQRQG
jgi:uncharacterized protein YceH (UPF0502 family)